MFVSTFLLDTKHHNIEKYLHKMFWFSFLMKNNLIKQTNINLSKYNHFNSSIKVYKVLKEPNHFSGG